MQDRVPKTRTHELYDGLLRNHLLPTFGAEPVASITLASIRRWRKERLDAGPNADRPFGPVTVAKWVAPEVLRGSGGGFVAEAGEVDGAGGVEGFLRGADGEPGD
jgi:hypothetical protein